MFFDAKKALLEMEARNAAIPATQDTKSPENSPRIAGIAVAERKSQKSAEITILDAVRAGNRRHGPASRASGLGTTNGYNEIERLRSNGKLHCAKDGLLTVIEGGDDAA